MKPTLDNALEHGYTQFRVVKASTDSLEHYGVKGMKWGKHKAKGDSSKYARASVVRTKNHTSKTTGVTSSGTNKRISSEYLNKVNRSRAAKQYEEEVEKETQAYIEAQKKIDNEVRNSAVEYFKKNPKAQSYSTSYEGYYYYVLKSSDINGTVKALINRKVDLSTGEDAAVFGDKEDDKKKK